MSVLSGDAAGAPPPAGPPLPPAAFRVADELLRRYGLGPPLDLRAAPGGLLNQNLVATTARGTFFLKGYRYPDPAPIERENRLIAFARRSGVPALEPLAGPGGATHLRAGSRSWAIFPFVDGTQPGPDEMTAARAAALGRTLGRLHVALAAVPAPEAGRFPPKPTWDSAAAAAEMAEYEATIARRPALDPFDQHTLSSFAYRRTLLAGGVPAPAAFQSLPAQVLHGDFHGENVFFDASNEVSAVIDWELACVGPRAWEVIRALDLALGLRADLAQGGTLTRAFLHAYTEVAPLTPHEGQAMPDLYWAARVHSLWVYEEHYRKGSAKSDRKAFEDLETLHWLASERQTLATTLRRLLEDAPGMRFSAG